MMPTQLCAEFKKQLEAKDCYCCPVFLLKTGEGEGES
jgi:hypothetical protein